MSRKEYSMTCREAIQEVFADGDGILTTNDVIARIYARYPDQPWRDSTIRAHLIALSVNHPSSHHYPSTRKHAFLFSLGNGRYRRWNPQQDGRWDVTDTGVQLVDEGEDVAVSEEDSELEASAIVTSISLERDLEKSLIANLEQLEPGLRLYDQEGLILVLRIYGWYNRGRR